MGIGTLRNLIRPLYRAVSSRTADAAAANGAFTNLASLRSISPLSNQFHRNNPSLSFFRSFQLESLASIAYRHYDRLTDTRYPKRPPQNIARLRSCKKHLNMKKKWRRDTRPAVVGPFAFIKHVPGEPVLSSQPNKGSVKRRNYRKRMEQHRQFNMAEKKKERALRGAAARKKMVKSIERKIAKVARERAWEVRLAEIEKEKKAA